MIYVISMMYTHKIIYNVYNIIYLQDQFLMSYRDTYMENKHKYIKLCKLMHGGEFLKYPPDFTNTSTYQNTHFVFPHDSAMQSNPDKLVEHFFRPDYIIPAYIRYSNPNFNGNTNDVMTILKMNDVFKVFGATYMYIKSLIEKIDNSDLNIIQSTLEEITNSNYSGFNEKKLNTYNLIKKYFESVNSYDFIVILDTICNVIQNIIIHTVRFVSINMKFPEWYSHNLIINIAILSNNLINSKPKLMVGMKRNYPIYFGEIIPIITNLKLNADNFNESDIIENW